MSEAVYDVLLESFLSFDFPYSPNADVQLLAASRIAIDSLRKGWKDLEKFKNSIEQEKEERTQVGL